MVPRSFLPFKKKEFLMYQSQQKIYIYKLTKYLKIKTKTDVELKKCENSLVIVSIEVT